MKLVTLGAAALLLGIVVTGCNRSEPPPPPPPAPPPSRPAGQLPEGHPPIGPATDMRGQSLPAAALAQAENPTWTVPPGWEAGQPSTVRRGSFLVKNAAGQTAEIAVTAFPGDVGGMLSNINRWRGQIGLRSATPEEVTQFSQDLDVNGLKATVVDFTANTTPVGKPHPQRMVVVTVPHAGNSWFFKMTGDAPLVETEKPRLLEFVQSVKFQAAP